MSEKTVCGVSFGTVRITDLHFEDDAVIFAETTEVLPRALGLRVSWIKTKVEALGDILDATPESIAVSGKM